MRISLYKWFIILVPSMLFHISIIDNADAREYLPPFVPANVCVADGYLQVSLSTPYTTEEGYTISRVVLPDDHKYFNAFLGLAMSAILTKSKLEVAIEPMYYHDYKWALLSVMRLLDN
jgi:hypothetical protein